MYKGNNRSVAVKTEGCKKALDNPFPRTNVAVKGVDPLTAFSQQTDSEAVRTAIVFPLPGKGKPDRDLSLPLFDYQCIQKKLLHAN